MKLRGLLFTSLVCFSTPASADFTADIEKVKRDDRAWFYLKVCASDEEIGPLRDLLDKFSAQIYTKSDTSDDANDWNWRYNGTKPEDYEPGECDRARKALKSSVYSSALSTSPPAPERYCGPKPGEFVELNKDGTVAAAFGGERVVYGDAGSVGTDIPGRVYGAAGQPGFSILLPDDEKIVTVVRNGSEATYTRCPE